MDLIRLVALVALIGCSASTHSAVIQISGNFNAFNGSSSVGNPPSINDISGSWSLTFDESIVVGSGLERFSGFTLDSVSLNPNPLGSTFFDLSNTTADLLYVDGGLETVTIGGAINDPSETMESNTDDFFATYSGVTGGVSDTDSVGWTISTEPVDIYFTNDVTGSLTVSAIPIPAAAWLFGSALLGLAAIQRKRV